MLAPLDELMLNFAVQLQEAVRTFIKMQLDAELQSFLFFYFWPQCCFSISLRSVKCIAS